MIEEGGYRWLILSVFDGCSDEILNRRRISEEAFVVGLVGALPKPNNFYQRWYGMEAADFICRQCGLGKYRMHSLAELAQHFNISIERVRQVERALGHRMRKASFSEFWECR